MTSASVQSDPAEVVAAVTSEELVRRASQGCAASFSRLAERYRPRLLQVVLGRIGWSRSADAEDIVQESLARAWQRIDQYNFKYRFSTWLFTIALRIATDHLRKWSRAPATEQFNQSIHSAKSDDQPFDQSESVNSIWSTAAEVLNETQFTALWLRYGEDLAVYEVARVLGRTRVGTRVLLHRARGVLMPHLQDVTEEQNVSQDAGPETGGRS